MDRRTMRLPPPHSSGQFLLRIADLIVRVGCDQSTLDLGAEPQKENFLVHDGVPDLSVRAGWAELSEDEVGNKLFDAGTVWQLYQDNGSYLFRFHSLTFGFRPYKIARFNRDFSNGEISLHPGFFEPGRTVDPLSGPLDELFYSAMLARGKGAAIHACGLIDVEGRGHLFVGRSGAGKTTMARLWQGQPGTTILSDDRIILRKLDGRIWMYGTPWHGEGGMASPNKVLLTRVYFLEKGDRNELLPKKNVEAALGLSACSFPPFYSREALDFTLDFAGEVAKKIPCYQLRVVPDEKVVEFISNQISSSN
jgi:hypothetical protein